VPPSSESMFKSINQLLLVSFWLLRSVIFRDLEDRRNAFIRNVSKFCPDHMTSYYKRHYSLRHELFGF
jgi:hypothetical protein